MFRIDAPDNVNNRFSEGNPQTGQPGTVVSADWLNAVQEELVAFITGMGLSLDKSNNGQLFAALLAFLARPNKWTAQQSFDGGNTLIDPIGITTDALRTSNYAETCPTCSATLSNGICATHGAVDGIPAAGAKLDHAGRALKVAPGNLQIGRWTLNSLGMTYGLTLSTVGAGGFYYLDGVNTSQSINPVYVTTPGVNALRYSLTTPLSTVLFRWHTIPTAIGNAARVVRPIVVWNNEDGNGYLTSVDIAFADLAGNWLDPYTMTNTTVYVSFFAIARP